jgi:asparagine synthase (glutamine-hydrolysing)
MCGIAGSIRLNGTCTTTAAGESVFAALAHRGPDSRAHWREGPADLFHCRLRVLDISTRADQPMERRDATGRRLIVAYNGEIYNFRALRESLQREGWTFTTTSDTEVLLNGYLAWGREVFRRARGMWAAAIWDPREGSLVLARDPLGKKPLVFALGAGAFTFASSVSALLPLLDHAPALDPTALDCYLGHLVVPWEHCILQGVTKVPPGATVEWRAGGEPRIERYWQVPDAPGPAPERPMDEVEALLRQAVRRRLESDVPLGIFLSAGYDSGLVAAMAAEESGRSLVAVTAGTSGSVHDERPVARLVAQRYGLDFRPLEVGAVSAAGLPMLLAELGEPFGDSSILPSYEVARAARREMTVALTGDGGDEGFFGYTVFRGVHLAAAYRRAIPRLVRGALSRATAADGAGPALRRAAAVLEYGATDLASGFRNRQAFGAAARRALLQDPPAGHRAEHIFAARLARWSALPDADALRRTWVETHLPNDYLTKLDTATMAASLEARSPFLDVDLIEYALRLPASVAFPRARLKGFLRPLAERLLPSELLNRPKSGFGVLVEEWMRGALQPSLEEFVFRADTLMGRLVHPRAARALAAEHQAGADHAGRLWALLALGVWCAVCVERRWLPGDALPMRASRARIGGAR